MKSQRSYDIKKLSKLSLNLGCLSARNRRIERKSNIPLDFISRTTKAKRYL